MKILLLICSVVVFIITAILCLVDPNLTVLQGIGVTGIGLALFAASFLPIP